MMIAKLREAGKLEDEMEVYEKGGFYDSDKDDYGSND